MHTLDLDTIDHLSHGFVTLDDVAAIVRGDLTLMREADLAAILCNVMADGRQTVASVIEPIVRAELARRRTSRTPSPLLLASA